MGTYADELKQKIHELEEDLRKLRFLTTWTNVERFTSTSPEGIKQKIKDLEEEISNHYCMLEQEE